MRYISLFSGIEAASVAWHPLGWTPLAFSEIAAFPSAVLAHHYPDVPNFGDVTKFKEWPDLGTVDLLVGGSPCQSFSVAGLRAGMADPRGNLILSYLAVIDRYRPKWVVYENVPGLLSSNNGRDFGSLLGGLAELGYGFAYRVLDAQFCRASGLERAVPQRRRRVFVVGYLGDWRRAAAVLFDAASLRGDPAPSRTAGKGFAADVVSSLTASGRGVERTGETRGQDPVVAVNGGLVTAEVAGTLSPGAHHGGFNGQDAHEGKLIAYGGNNTSGPINVATAVNAHGGPAGRIDFESETFVAHALRAEGFDQYGNMTGPLDTDGHTMAVAFDMRGREGGAQFEGPHDTANIRAASGGSSRSYVAHAIQAGALRENPNSGPDGVGVSEGIAYTIEARAEVQAVAWSIMPQNSGKDYKARAVEVAQPIMAAGPTGGNQGGDYIQEAWAVRRLTPTECARLQGFPDDYLSQVTYRGKPPADGPMYKALGNSMAVNVMRVIGERIAMVEAI